MKRQIAIQTLNPNFSNGAYMVCFRRKRAEPSREVLITADKDTITTYFKRKFSVKEFDIVELSEERAKQKSKLLSTYVIRTYK